MEPQRRELWRGVALRGSWLWGSQIQVTSEGGTIGISILACSPPFNQSPARTVSRKTVSLFFLVKWNLGSPPISFASFSPKTFICHLPGFSNHHLHLDNSIFPFWFLELPNVSKLRKLPERLGCLEALIYSYHNYCSTSDWSKKDVIFLLLFCWGFHWHL